MSPAGPSCWLLLPLLAPLGRAAPSQDLRSSSSYFVDTVGCSEGLLHGPERRSPEVPLASFLSLSFTPMMDVKKDCSVQLVFSDRYRRAVYLLDVSQTQEVGCWVSLRHVRSYELVTKVLWPVGVLQGFERTLLTVVLRSGVLRVTALTQHYSLNPAIRRHNTSLSSSHAFTTSYYSGPYLLLTSLRSLHDVWEAPATVQLRLPTPSIPLHYTINCHSDDLQWAWMEALEVRQETLAWLLPWGLVGILSGALLLLLARWRWGCSLPCFSNEKRKISNEMNASRAGAIPPVSSAESRSNATRQESLNSSAFTNYAYLFS